MPLPRQSAQPLSRFFGLTPGPGQTPDASEFNDYLASIPQTVEQQRETGIIQNADARAEAGIRSSLEEANAVRDARNRGFEGSYPLQEQENYSANQKLRQILAPKQLELQAEQAKAQAEMERRQAAQEFQAEQGRMNRENRTQIAASNQQAMTQRAQLPMREKAGSNDGWGNLFGLLGSKAPAAPQAPPQASGAIVEMIDPSDGSTLDVPADQVAFAESQGARRK